MLDENKIIPKACDVNRATGCLSMNKLYFKMKLDNVGLEKLQVRNIFFFFSFYGSFLHVI